MYSIHRSIYHLLMSRVPVHIQLSYVTPLFHHALLPSDKGGSIQTPVHHPALEEPFLI